MKRNWLSSVLSAVMGLMMAGLAVICFMEKFLDMALLEKIHRRLKSTDALWTVLSIAAILILLLLAVWCFCRIFGEGRNRNYVQQQTDIGGLGISLQAIDSLVHKCTDGHEDIHVTRIGLFNHRDSLVIRLHATLAPGINIPLTVTSLQKQVKQYVTACSGIDVREVQVIIDETAGVAPEQSAIVVPLDTQRSPRDPETTETVPAGERELTDDEGRTVHQRLFGHQEREAILPELPPESVRSDDAEESAAVVSGEQEEAEQPSVDRGEQSFDEDDNPVRSDSGVTAPMEIDREEIPDVEMKMELPSFDDEAWEDEKSEDQEWNAPQGEDNQKNLKHS